ncbi:MAG TPA: Crp/Fnr family transcriptional regulator [Pyrinomonadaceae bacterium]|jgi:CRP-like cAMP-binding protein
MSEPIPPSDLFKEQLLNSLRRANPRISTIRVPKHNRVYSAGDQDKMIYIIESGQIKLAALSREGRECLLGIRIVGDLFGESCLSELGTRLETATAMENSILKRVPCETFLKYLSSDTLLLNGFLQYLAERIAEQQQVIVDLMTINSEYRLGKALLQLGDKLGKKYPSTIRIEHRISHEELSQIVGTTRPRISEFMQKFRALGLIEMSAEHFLIIKKNRLADYLARVT